MCCIYLYIYILSTDFTRCIEQIVCRASPLGIVAQKHIRCPRQVACQTAVRSTDRVLEHRAVFTRVPVFRRYRTCRHVKTM